MSTVNWTRHEYTPIADATEREAWYRAAGLGDWFDITMGTGGSNADVFTIQPYTDGARLVLEWYNMTAAGTQRLSNTSFYLAGSSSVTTIRTVAGGTTGTHGLISGSTQGKLSFDFATVGSVELLRLCTTENTWSEGREMIFARDTTVTADGDTAHLTVMSSPFASSTNAYPVQGTYIFMPDTTGATLYSTASSSDSPIQFVKRSIGYCDKYILQPIQTRGIISHIYAIDGSPNYAPMGDTEFILGSRTYYSLGHGMCVRVK